MNPFRAIEDFLTTGYYRITDGGDNDYALRNERLKRAVTRGLTSTTKALIELGGETDTGRDERQQRDFEATVRDNIEGQRFRDGLDLDRAFGMAGRKGAAQAISNAAHDLQADKLRNPKV